MTIIVLIKGVIPKRDRKSSRTKLKCPACPPAAVGPSEPTALCLFIGHDSLYSEISPWSVQVSCPGCVPF